MNRLTFVSIVLSLTTFVSKAQEGQVSLMDDISYVYIEKLIAVAKENYPRVKALNSRIKISETSLTNAKLAWLSPFSLSYVYSPANTLNITNPTFFSGYQISFAINLSNILQNPSNIKRAKEERKLEYLSRDEYLLSLVTEVKTRYFTYLAAVKNLKLTNQSILDAQNLVTMLRYRYEKGEVTFTEYNAAVTAFASGNQSRVNAEVTLLSAKAALEELLGIRLEEVPN
jgi:outer membrane protein TolC